MNLSRFEKPSRYINGEVNAVHKRAEVKVALAFPDIYDVGMSHLGLRILYKIINDLDFACAERVFSPWLDMEAEMKAKGILLASLETGRPVRDFDIVGFSLQYELSYTTVLNMLSMSGISLRSEDRDERDPLIIAGGPIAVNPLPMSAFIDAFLVGDGEDAIKDIVETFYSFKKSGFRKRDSILRSLSMIDGMYVPSIHNNPPAFPLVKGNGRGLAVKKRFIESLDDAPYPVAPVVPFTSIVHDRINIEIARGCTMGCRFCQAGMTYRPLRERSPERILQIAKDSLRSTGHEEIALTSLSAGDYSCLLSVVKQLNRTFAHKMVSLSLPSLRVATVDRDVLKEIKAVRKTGFTIAPEAATGRLRSVINKDFNEEDYEKALHALFAEGWENIKLYFMIGLPDERDEDVEAIPHMALQAIKVAKRYSRRHVNVNVGISPFVPKPHTPFQWCGQENLEAVRTKASYLRQRLSKKGMNFRGHNTETSLLEAVFSRGDSSLSDLIEKAWSMGCRLDAWTEAFDFRKWLAAAEATGVDIHAYAARRFEKDDPLPWEVVDPGVKKEYLWREYQHALSCEITTDCRKECSGCGLNCARNSEDTGCRIQDVEHKAQDKECIAHRASGGDNPPKIRVRFQFSKSGDMRYLSHRELMTAIIRAARRSDMPVAYSRGFHPSPRLSFGPPLNVGVAGLREYFDMDLMSGHGIANLKEDLNRELPDCLMIKEAVAIAEAEPSLQSFISRYEYEIICPDPSVIDDFLASKSAVVDRGKTAGADNAVDLRAMVEEATVMDDHTVRMIVKDVGEDKVRLGELISTMFKSQAEELLITRMALYGWKNGWVEPMLIQDAGFKMREAEHKIQDAGCTVQDAG